MTGSILAANSSAAFFRTATPAAEPLDGFREPRRLNHPSASLAHPRLALVSLFADTRGIAEQLTAVKRWYRIVGHALIKYLRGQQLRLPPPLQHAQPCPVRLKTAFGARVPTHGFSLIRARLSQTIVLWQSNRIALFGCIWWPNDLEARGGLLYTLAVVAHQAGRKSRAGSASRLQNQQQRYRRAACR
jgi:hypothetical protein